MLQTIKLNILYFKCQKRLTLESHKTNSLSIETLFKPGIEFIKTLHTGKIKIYVDLYKQYAVDSVDKYLESKF